MRGQEMVDIVTAKESRPMSGVHNQLTRPKHLKNGFFQKIIVPMRKGYPASLMSVARNIFWTI